MLDVRQWISKLTLIRKWLFAGLFFLTPLILWPKTSELFEFNKMLVVYLFSLLIGGSYLMQSIIEKRLTLIKSPLDWGLGLFLVSQVLATVTSINPHTSIWGYYSRFHGGLASTLAYVVLFYLLAGLLNSLTALERKKIVRMYLYTILASAILVAVYAVLERLGIDKDWWVQDVQNRVFSTLGQPNWLSAYLAALLPLPIYLTIQAANPRLKFFWAGTALLFFVAILFTRSRSGIATTFVILGFIAARELWLKLRHGQINLSCWGFLAAALLVSLWFGTPWTPNPNEIRTRIDLGGPLWSEVELWLNRVGLSTQVKPLERDRLKPTERQILETREAGERVGGSSSMEIRRVVWQGAVELFKRRPFLGTGVETFGYSYYWTRPVAHNTLSEWDFLYNKAHNEYLNFLATTGLIGLSAYLLLLFQILRLYLSTMRNSPLAFPLLMGFVSILITNFFGFSVVTIALFTFLFPVLVMFNPEDSLQTRTFGSGWNLSRREQKTKITPDTLQYGLLTLLILGLIWALSGVWRMWRADLLYSEGKLYHQAGYIGQALPRLENAVKVSANEPVFQAQLAESYADLALALHQQLLTDEASGSANLQKQVEAQRQMYSEKAIQSAQIAVEANPWHLNFWKTKAKVELTLALIDPVYFEAALSTLARANELAPTDAKIIYNLGLIYENLGRLDQARQAYEKALELKPDYEAVKVELERLSSTP